MNEACDTKKFDGFNSPWSFQQKMAIFLWSFCWFAFCIWTPKPLNFWRCFWLRLFGAKISGNPFVHSRARIQIPWNLTLHDRSCLGDRANAYSLGKIEIGAFACIAQEAYLCTGTHEFDDVRMPLVTLPIKIGEHAFVGARAFILPGVIIGSHAIVGAGSVVARSVKSLEVVAGNPAVVKKLRKLPSGREPLS